MVKRIFLVCLASALIVMTAACGWAATATPTPTHGAGNTVAVPLKPISIATISVGANLIGIYMAKEKGYFAEAGYEVSIPIIRGSAAMAALSSDQVDFVTPVDIVTPAATQGLPIKVLLTFSKWPDLKLVAGKNIRSPDQLKGKAIGINSVGTQTYYGARLLLQKLGVDPDSVTYVAVGRSGGLRMQAVVDGNVAATVAGISHLVKFSPDDYHVLGTVGREFPYPGYGLAASDATIQQHPDKVQAIVTAILKGMQTARVDKQAAVGIYQKVLGLDPASAEMVWNQNTESMATDGIMTVDTMKAEQLVVPSLAGMDPQTLLDKTTDFSFARKAAAELSKCSGGKTC